MAGVTATMGMGLLMGAQTGALADVAPTAPTATVTPSTGLTDGATVQIAASGFGANETLTAGQCATVDGKAACNVNNRTELTTDGSGGASAAMVVNRSFEAVFADDGTFAGTVDCGTAACYIGVGNFSGQGDQVPIGFR
ncbi:enediyne antibiotic chromoprotein [Actinomadura sediminis]|uniref:Enediyne antibiotic chromoprotein n=1 Tax=Actinomadura sediminis TaxID=1038904 RepID=A0ABW3ELI3_9ACTN